jgi:hypothetical protein
LKGKKALVGMRLGLISVALICSGNSLGQEEQKPKMSEKPLTITQIEVYRAFLMSYLEGSKERTNVAERTEPMEPSKEDFKGCMSQFPKGSSAKKVHIFTTEFAQDDRIRLVDADKYEISDVGNFTRRKEDLDNAVQEAINAGLLTLSEVVFDSQHQRAALSFGFRCGRLCGGGGTAIFELHQRKWIRSKRSCGGWKS